MSRFAVNFIYFISSLFGASLNSIFVSAAVMIPIIFLALLFLNGSILGNIFGSFLAPAFLITFIFVFFFYVVGQMNEVMSSKQARLGNAASYLSSQTSLFGQLLQLEALNILLEDGSPEALEILVNVFSDCKEIIVLHKILNYLEQISDQGSIDIVCAGWARNRHKDLASLLIKKGWVAFEPLNVRVLSALKTKHFQIITDGGEEIVEPLLSLFEDRDSEIANRASECAISLNNLEAIESLCRLVIEQDHPIARQVALTANYLPKDPVQKALFYFITEQWDKYEGLDFDQTLLQKAHELENEQLRQRITEKLRQAGRVEWLKVIVGGNQTKRLEAMTDDEWDTTVAVLNNSQQWKTIWQLAQKAPAVWSKELIQNLNQVKWLPTVEEEREIFERLEQLAVKCREKAELTCCKATFTGHDSCIDGVSFSPNGLLLASYGSELIKLWQMPERELIATLTHEYWVEGEREIGIVKGVSFSPDGRLLASCSKYDDNAIKLWQIPNGQLLTTFTGHDNYVNGVSFSPDGRLLASCSTDQTIRLWQMPNGQLLTTLTGHTDEVNGVSFSPDGRLLASCSNDQTIKLWQMPDGQPLTTLTGHEFWVEGVSFSPNGRILASCGGGEIKLWQMPGGQLLTTFTHSSINRISFSPDGRLLASCGSGEIKLWQIPDGKNIATLARDEYGFREMSFSPNGRLLASCSGKGDIKLWSMDLPDLPRLIEIPIKQLCQQDRNYIERVLQNQKITEEERHWLEFMQALMNLHQRFDVEVEDAHQLISTGEFDIEIES